MKDLTEFHEAAEKLLTAALDFHNEAVTARMAHDHNQKGEALFCRLVTLTEIQAQAAADVEEHLAYMEDEADAKWKEKRVEDHRMDIFKTAADISKAALGG